MSAPTSKSLWIVSHTGHLGNPTANWSKARARNASALLSYSVELQAKCSHCPGARSGRRTRLSDKTSPPETCDRGVIGTELAIARGRVPFARPGVSLYTARRERTRFSSRTRCGALRGRKCDGALDEAVRPTAGATTHKVAPRWTRNQPALPLLTVAEHDRVMARYRKPPGPERREAGRGGADPAERWRSNASPAVAPCAPAWVRTRAAGPVSRRLQYPSKKGVDSRGVPRGSVNSANCAKCRRMNALSPEVARHQSVNDRAALAFNSRRLH